MNDEGDESTDITVISEVHFSLAFLTDPDLFNNHTQVVCAYNNIIRTCTTSLLHILFSMQAIGFFECDIT
jgi:hypothetical protein